MGLNIWILELPESATKINPSRSWAIPRGYLNSAWLEPSLPNVCWNIPFESIIIEKKN